MGELRLIRKPSQAILWLAVSAVLALLLRASFLPEVSFLGVGLFIFPVLLLFAAALGGALPAFASLAVLCGVSFELYGPNGLWLLAYLAPLCLAFIICLQQEIPFFKTAGILIATYVFSVLFVFLMLQRLAGGDLFGTVARAAVAGLETMPLRDSLLMALWRSGFLQHGQEASELIFESAAGRAWTFKPEVLSQFYKQIDARVTLLLSGLMPGLITSNALTVSLLGSGLALKAAARYQTAPTLGMPPFSQWHLPKAAGTRMLVLAAGYLLTLMANSPVMRMTGQLMYNVFFSLYAIQGLAYVNFTLKRRGTRRAWRFLALMVLQSLLPTAAMLLGVFDQVADPRKLRAAATPA